MMPKDRYNSKLQPVVRLPKETEITPDLISELIMNWGRFRQRYEALDMYYSGVHDILYRKYEDPSKPNNRLVNNFASYIVDIRVGYFSGIPATTTCNDEAMLSEINKITVNNNGEDVIAEIDRMSNIKGHAFELLWIDENGDIRFKELSPDNTIMVYTSDIACEPLYAIRYYDEIDPISNISTYKKVFVYTSETITEYNMTIMGNGFSSVVKQAMNIQLNNEFSLEAVSFEKHYFGRVPIIEYTNNSLRMGSFEEVVTLIDAYNNATSDAVNEIDYFADAYLLLKNMSGTESEDIAKMKENRVLMVEGDGEAAWLTKSINDAYLENIKERLTRDIHKFSKTPNLISEHFVSNLSGTAIAYKMWGLEQDTAKKERQWKKAIHERNKMICNILNTKGNNFDPNNLGVTFNRNIPHNIVELGQMISQLRGTISDETLLAQVPFVENPKAEIERVLAEKKVNMEMMAQYAPVVSTQAATNMPKAASTMVKPSNVKPDTHKPQ